MRTDGRNEQHMKKGSQKKISLVILLTVIAVTLSGCYTEPISVTSGTDTSSGNSVPYPVYSVEPEPTEFRTVEIPTPEVAQTPMTIIQLPGGNATPFVQGGPLTTPAQDDSGMIYLNTGTPMPQTNTPRPTATPAATPTVLRFGSQGKAVRELQTALKKLGYYTGLVDGDFGESTKRAVTAFQRANGLTADGVAGKQTLDLLNGSVATAKPTATPKPKATATPKLATSISLKRGAKGAEVSRMQIRLISLGYLDGKATGTLDAVTELAVIAYQNRAGLTADGVAGFTTLNSMYSARATKATNSAGIIGVVLKTGSSETNAIRTLQRKLKSLGYYNSTINGTYGANTKEAVSNFQKQNGMSADGVAGTATLVKLFTGTPNRYSATATPRRTATPKGGTKAAATPARNTGNTSKASDSAPKVTNPPSYVTVTEAPNGNYVTLQMGDGGTLVGNLQRALKKLGYYSGNISSHYAATTYRGIMDFQGDNGLKPTGIADAATQKKLFNVADSTPAPRKRATPTPAPRITNPPEYTNVTPAPNGKKLTLRMGDGGTLVADLQRALKELGYYAGNISSHYAATTYNAVLAFQKDYGLNQTGIADVNTQNRLFASVSRTATPKPTATNPPIYRTVTNPPARTYVTLRVGDSGDPVKALQQALKKAGYYKGTADGKYGESTFEAVLAFQKANGLAQTGRADANTQKMLYGVTPTASPSPVPVTNPPSFRAVTNPPVGSNYVTLRMGDSGAPVELLQRALRNGGYFKGNVDGQYGATTYRAVLSFQANNGLKQTGIADAKTQELLFGGKYNRTPTPTVRPTPTPAPKGADAPNAAATPKPTNSPTPTPLGNSATKPPAYTAVTNKPDGGYVSLRMGDSGQPVVRLQGALRRAGYYKGNSDGNFGKTTYQAVLAYQKDHGMQTNGIASVNLQQELFSTAPKAVPTRTPKPSPTPTKRPTATPRVTNPPSYRTVTEAPPDSNYITLQMGDYGIPVQMLQEGLKRLGYFKGNVNGHFDTATFNAVLDFQRAKGLKTNGVANAATQIILYQGDFPDES